jgi:hypothetical protein
MTRTLPWRRITLHFSQIFLTLGRTFMEPLDDSGDGLLGAEQVAGTGTTCSDR